MVQDNFILSKYLRENSWWYDNIRFLFTIKISVFYCYRVQFIVPPTLISPISAHEAISFRHLLHMTILIYCTTRVRLESLPFARLSRQFVVRNFNFLERNWSCGLLSLGYGGVQVGGPKAAKITKEKKKKKEWEKGVTEIEGKRGGEDGGKLRQNGMAVVNVVRVSRLSAIPSRTRHKSSRPLSKK